MDIFELLDREAPACELSWLVIGGHAVNAYAPRRSRLCSRSMATPNFMDRFSEPCREDGATAQEFRAQPPDLQFPDAPEFVSKPPRLPWLLIYDRSKARLQYKASRPDFDRRRLEAKSSEEFVL